MLDGCLKNPPQAIRKTIVFAWLTPCLPPSWIWTSASGLGLGLGRNLNWPRSLSQGHGNEVDQSSSLQEGWSSFPAHDHGVAHYKLFRHVFSPSVRLLNDECCRRAIASQGPIRRWRILDLTPTLWIGCSFWSSTRLQANNGLDKHICLGSTHSFQRYSLRYLVLTQNRGSFWASFETRK